MANLLESLSFFKKKESFSNGLGTTVTNNSPSEDFYRKRWSYDKVVRSTHGVNCTGSCSWQIFVKNGLITWEIQATDYPRTKSSHPNHEPRGCPRGASYSWYVYSANRLKYPLIRRELFELWQQAKAKVADPVKAWGEIITNKNKTTYKKKRGKGGFVRIDWNEVTNIIAAANIYTIKTYGPDRIAGFSPIPAMSMVSYAAGARYLSLIGGVCLSFYDWYCDLPPSSPQIWGEQTDVPESADWYNSGFIIMWGSNVPMTRTPDAHFMTEARYRGTKTAVIAPDFNEAAKFADKWLPVKQGTDAAFALAMGHVILKEFYLEKEDPYFKEYALKYTDMPFLIVLEEKDGYYVPSRMLRASDFKDNLNVNNAEWKPLVYDQKRNNLAVPNGTIGARWEGKSAWNLENIDERDKKTIDSILTLAQEKHEIAKVAYPYFGGDTLDYFNKDTQRNNVFYRSVPALSLEGKSGTIKVATVFDLMVANYGIDRGFGGEEVAKDYKEDIAYTPAWQEKITGVKAEDCISLAREFAKNASITKGKSMVIIGAAMNHWYNSDMQYRSVINLLMMCGCNGQNGGGWAHYVGQEKLRPQTGWQPIAFGLDWGAPPRHMNSTSFFYFNTNQWQYEELEITNMLSPLANKERWQDVSLADCNLNAVKMGFLPSAPFLKQNTIELSKEAEKSGIDIKEYVVKGLKEQTIDFAYSDPNHTNNHPKNMFVWRSNLLGSSAKGHEYFIKHFLGADGATLNTTLKEKGKKLPKHVTWRDEESGKLDLLVTLDFRMSTTCLYSDIVLPTATWYEKYDISTTDMHPFIHPFNAAVDPLWESKSDWDIYKLIAKKFSSIAGNHLGVEKDVVLTPIMHDSPGEIAQALGEVKLWSEGECDLIPGKTAPNITVVTRDYPNTYKKFTSLGPLLEQNGNGGKGIKWQTKEEVRYLKEFLGEVQDDGISKGLVKMENPVAAIEAIMALAPETNGEVAAKSWDNLGKTTGRNFKHLYVHKQEEKITFNNIKAQPRKIFTSPIWSGIDSDEINYTGNYTNVHELIPWRTLTGRQSYYMDHKWLLDFGEAFAVYKPPVDFNSVTRLIPKGEDHVVLNIGTPHSKWSIHSTYSDNLIMLTLSRGGPHVWISEVDAKVAKIKDNDWVEVYNANGAVAARAVVSQRMPQGLLFMYHAQEKIVNTPLASQTGKRGGIHNSTSRIAVKPTHMVGGYAQFSYGFNYYGTVGCNRDDFVIVKKLQNVTWE